MNEMMVDITTTMTTDNDNVKDSLIGIYIYLHLPITEETRRDETRSMYGIPCCRNIRLSTYCGVPKLYVVPQQL